MNSRLRDSQLPDGLLSQDRRVWWRRRSRRRRTTTRSRPVGNDRIPGWAVAVVLNDLFAAGSAPPQRGSPAPGDGVIAVQSHSVDAIGLLSLAPAAPSTAPPEPTPASPFKAAESAALPLPSLGFMPPCATGGFWELLPSFPGTDVDKTQVPGIEGSSQTTDGPAIADAGSRTPTSIAPITPTRSPHFLSMAHRDLEPSPR